MLAVLPMSGGTIMSYELSSVAAGIEEVGKSGDRIEGESASSTLSHWAVSNLQQGPPVSS